MHWWNVTCNEFKLIICTKSWTETQDFCMMHACSTFWSTTNPPRRVLGLQKRSGVKTAESVKPIISALLGTQPQQRCPMSWPAISEYRGYICIHLFLHLDNICINSAVFPYSCCYHATVSEHCYLTPRLSHSHNTHEFVQDTTACHHMRKTLCGILSMCTQ